MEGFSGRVITTVEPASVSNFPSLLRRRPRDPPQQVAPRSGTLNRSLELAASGVNVPTPRPPYKGWNSRIPQNLLKCRHALLPRSLEVNSRARIQRNQIHFAPQPAQQLRNLSCIPRLVIHATKEHVFECDPLSRAQRKISRSRNQHFQIPFLVQRHQPGTQCIVRSIQRNRQLWPNRFSAKVTNARHNPGRRHRHAPLRDPDAVHQQSRRLYEILIIQEWLAHPHKNQVNAILRRRNLLIFQNCANLGHNLGRRQVALHPPQRRQTELAIDRTAYLTGDANRRTPECACIFSRRIFSRFAVRWHALILTDAILMVASPTVVALTGAILGSTAFQRCDRTALFRWGSP